MTGHGSTGADAPPAPPEPPPLDDPARPDDADRGKVRMSYDGYALPWWVVLPWAGFLSWAVWYLIAYLFPHPGGAGMR